MLTKENLENTFGRPFKDDGENYKGCCPVHNEKTASFYVHRDLLIVHCFGCGASGHLSSFVQNLYGLSEAQAQKLLGLTLDDEINAACYNQLIPPKPTTFPESWLAPFTKGAHKYVVGRGLSVSTLAAAGAVYDHHRQRQVFPHRDREGKLVGAIGRACKGQDPKWYFYWQYPKGNYLYGLPTDKVDSPTWVVEGIFDVLWLFQHGIRAVSTQGSKPTQRQLQELKDYDRLVLAYDNDLAGELGTEYLYRRLHKSCRIEVVAWPDGVNDAMDIDPTELEVQNVVQRTIVQSSAD